MKVCGRPAEGLPPQRQKPLSAAPCMALDGPSHYPRFMVWIIAAIARTLRWGSGIAVQLARGPSSWQRGAHQGCPNKRSGACFRSATIPHPRPLKLRKGHRTPRRCSRAHLQPATYLMCWGEGCVGWGGEQVGLICHEPVPPLKGEGPRNTDR